MKEFSGIKTALVAVLLFFQEGDFAFWGVMGRSSPGLLPSDTESLVQQVKPLRVCRVVKG